MPIELQLVLAGAIGALAKDILQDGYIQLPFIQDGRWYLGFMGGLIIGAFVGYIADNSPITAALSGYVGVSAISHLLPSDESK
jgi:cell division protein FtsX